METTNYPVTEKLYDADAYAVTFTATVLSCVPSACPLPQKKGEEKESSYYKVLLDRTLFFPEEGGQACDSGTVNDCEVAYVELDGNYIYHYLKTPLETGAKVTGTIEWNERFSKMQNHTGEHILSGLIHRHFGYDNTGFHLGSNEITLDINGMLSPDDLLMIETKANEAVFANVTLYCRYPAPEELVSMEYRSKLDLTENVRIVTIPGYDDCACCAPHVKMTGEVGMIKIIKAISYKGGMRISFLCGRRALAEIQGYQNSVQKISMLLSAKTDEIIPAVDKLKSDMAALKYEMIALQKKAVSEKAALLPDGTVHICYVEDSMDADVQREFVNLLTERATGYCGVFTGSDEAGYRYIIGASSLDTRELNQTLREQYQAKGGGKKEMVQGSLTITKEEIERLFSSL